MDKEIKFVEGVFVKKPNENAPSFVKYKMSFNVDKLIPWLKSNANAQGYINMDLKEGQKGNLYLQVDTFVPKPKEINIDNIGSSASEWGASPKEEENINPPF